MLSLAQFVKMLSTKLLLKKWNGPVVNFATKIKSMRDQHAYTQGVDAFSNNEPQQSPYTDDFKLDLDWLDGYLDAKYLRNM